MSKDNITLTLSAKDLASGVVGRVRASTIALGTAVGMLAAKMVTGAINGLRGWVNEALEAEAANVKLDASLRGLGQYTPQLARQYRDLADAIQDETGSSDESVKANIAMLATMGVLPGQMAEAARAVQAFSAMGLEGAMAARGIAMAIQGDIEGLKRMIPGVRSATNATEAYAAANQFLAAAYEQQKSQLLTVGGAWAALKGRLGDAREEIIGAVFEGTKLGGTLNDMQAAVGRFLKSDSFKGFTDALRDGAAYAKDILKALTSGNGGFGETAVAIGDVILEAMKDGGHYVAQAITNALKDSWVGRRVEDIGVGLGVMADPIGKLTDFAAGYETKPDSFYKDIYGKKGGAGGQPYQSGSPAARARLDAVIAKRTVSEGGTAEAAEQEAKAAEDAAKDAAAKAAAAKLLRDGLAKAKQKEIDEIEAKIKDIRTEQSEARKIAALDVKITTAKEKVALAEELLAKAKDVQAKAAQENINDWIAGKAAEKGVAKQNEKDLDAATKRARELEGRQRRGTRLSTGQEEWLAQFQANRQAAGGGAVNAAQAAVDATQKRLEQLQKDRDAVQDKQLKELAKLTKLLEDNLKV